MLQDSTKIRYYLRNLKDRGLITNTFQAQQKKIRLQFPMEGLLIALDNTRLKIDAAAGAATFLELHLRIIAQHTIEVQDELTRLQILRKVKKVRYHQADLIDLIDAVIIMFQDKLDLNDQNLLKSCRIPRNKTTHGSFAELMIALSGEAPVREIDLRTMKRKPLAKDVITEGAICIDRNKGLEDFTRQANEAVNLLRNKVLRSL